MVIGRGFGLDGAELGNGDLVFAQVLQQEGLERLVGPVDLVDQQHRAGRWRLQRLQQRAADQVARLVDLALDFFGGDFVLRGAHVQQLRRVVPLVQGLALLHAVVTLQAQHGTAQHLGQRLGQLGLAHARLAFEQQRALQLHGEKDGGGELARRVVTHALQGVGQVVDAGETGFGADNVSTIGFLHRFLGLHLDQLRAEGGAGMQVAVELAGIDGHTFDRLGREALGQRGFQAGMAEDAVARAGDRHAHAAGRLRHEHADQRKARSRLAELGVGGFLGRREAGSR